MKTYLIAALSVLSFESFAGNPFPRIPDAAQTPGSLCSESNTYRYPEQIKYCERAVNSFDKELVFMAYRKLGYSLSGPRGNYKVDHFIPLCAGGSNNTDNLWPQYFTISKITDPLEPLACEVLAAGKISQKEVVDLIKEAKTNLKETPRIIKLLRSLK